MQTKQQKPEHWTPAAVGVVATLAAVVAVIALQQGLPFKVWGVPIVAAAGAVATVLVTIMQDRGLYTHVHRTTSWLAGGVWVTWTALTGWTGPATVFGVVAAIVLTGAGYACRPQPGEAPADPDEPFSDRRPTRVREWEARLRQITKQRVTVTGIEPWERREDGLRLYVELPEDTGMTTTELASFTDRIQHAARLPKGCVVRILDADRQGTAIVDVMLRDCLSNEVTVDESTEPASINDEFTVMTSPRGESLDICLRIFSTVIGGTVGSGKTTLLHRIIMFLARCTDALVWVVDTNGGGVAETWISPWARGEADRPVVDWIADTEEEAAVMVAVAAAVVKDRKINTEGLRRKQAANTDVLPVDEKMPAIIILTDEGGEVRKARSLLGQLAADGITQLAQIGRAEGIRAIMSVLRGTADTVDKSLRVVAALRLCLRMEEDDEYMHVLGAHPGRTRLLHKGSAYLRRDTDPKPIFGRTVNVPRDARERHAVACADLRPELDERAQQVAAGVRPRDVLGGRDPAPEIARLPIMRDVAAGRAYSGRWERYAAKLAQMRGEEFEEVQPDEPAPEPSAGGTSTPLLSVPEGSALSRFLTATGVEPQAQQAPAPAVQEAEPPGSGVDLDDPESVNREAARLLGELDAPVGGPAREPVVKMTTREHIVAILTETYPEPLTPNEIGRELAERGAACERTHCMDTLKKMLEDGSVVKPSYGHYTVPR
jgi:hypothetical protein